MFGTEIIEVAIGMAFSYFAISIVCSGIVELFVKITRMRSSHLKTALGELLDDRAYTGFVKQLYDHYLITPALRDRLKEKEPVYIDAKNFSAAVLDILGKNDELSDAEQFKLIEERILAIKDPKVKGRLLGILNSSAQKFDTMRDKVESWFNDSMEGVSEWYRERMRTMVTIVSFVVVGLMNADTIRMATMFWNDDELRTATVATAQSYADAMKSKLDSTSLDSASVSIKASLVSISNDIEATKVLPIGWTTEPIPGQKGFDATKDPIMWWLLKIMGLILTVGAVSLGSTYWYRQLKSLLSFKFGDKGPAETPPSPNVNVSVAAPGPPATQLMSNSTPSVADVAPEVFGMEDDNAVG